MKIFVDNDDGIPVAWSKDSDISVESATEVSQDPTESPKNIRWDFEAEQWVKRDDAE